MRPIDCIILHCSATPEGRDVKAEDIKRWHVQERGWRDIGYHYVIELDGRVRPGRPIEMQGAHCTGHNKTSIGICYVGGLAEDMIDAKDTRTEQQKVAMFNLVEWLKRKYQLSYDQIHCHNEFSQKSCPSFDIVQYRKEHCMYVGSMTGMTDDMWLHLGELLVKK